MHTVAKCISQYAHLLYFDISVYPAALIPTVFSVQCILYKRYVNADVSSHASFVSHVNKFQNVLDSLHKKNVKVTFW